VKIAFINTSINGGGAERATVNLANGLCKLDDMEIFLFTGNKKEKENKIDSKIKRYCILQENLLKDINKTGKTVIIVTHDTKIASMTNRIITINDGKIINDSYNELLQ